MTGKFDEYCTWTDDESSLEELDAEHFGKSVRERVDNAARVKAERSFPARYFYEIIEETADDFLVEGQVYPENKQRFYEIHKAYHELLPAFRVLREHVKDDRVLDGAIRDVMWSSFLIGLACDRERLENPEILEKYSSSVAGKARDRRKESQDSWHEEVYREVSLAIPIARAADKQFEKLSRTTKQAENLRNYVIDRLVKREMAREDMLVTKLEPETTKERQKREDRMRISLEGRLKVAAVRRAVGRFIDEHGKTDASSRSVPGQDIS